MSNRPIHLLAVSGSLRARSTNTTVLQAMIELAPVDVAITLYDGLASLPPFNPDLDGDDVPPAVRDLRDLIGRADGVLICSPEYAHGVPGALKNALDWLVGSREFPGKPVALINAAPRATHAQAQLVEILTTMSARLISAASITVPLTTNRVELIDLGRDPRIADVLRGSITAFVQALQAD